MSSATSVTQGDFLEHHIARSPVPEVFYRLKKHPTGPDTYEPLADSERRVFDEEEREMQDAWNQRVHKLADELASPLNEKIRLYNALAPLGRVYNHLFGSLSFGASIFSAFAVLYTLNDNKMAALVYFSVLATWCAGHAAAYCFIYMRSPIFPWHWIESTVGVILSGGFKYPAALADPPPAIPEVNNIGYTDIIREVAADMRKKHLTMQLWRDDSDAHKELEKRILTALVTRAAQQISATKTAKSA
jgi:hypothetical protein